MSSATTNIIEVDARGFVCPSSLLVALRELNSHKEELQSGVVRMVLQIDNHESTNRICEAAKSMGYTLEVAETPYGYSVTVFKVRSMKDGYL